MSFIPPGRAMDMSGCTGISENEPYKLFVPFTRMDSSAARQFAGTGPGLVKNFVEMNVGRVWVESGVGNGSRFTFTLPHEVNVNDF